MRKNVGWDLIWSFGNWLNTSFSFFCHWIVNAYQNRKVWEKCKRLVIMRFCIMPQLYYFRQIASFSADFDLNIWFYYFCQKDKRGSGFAAFRKLLCESVFLWCHQTISVFSLQCHNALLICHSMMHRWILFMLSKQYKSSSEGQSWLPYWRRVPNPSAQNGPLQSAL